MGNEPADRRTLFVRVGVLGLAALSWAFLSNGSYAQEMLTTYTGNHDCDGLNISCHDDVWSRDYDFVFYKNSNGPARLPDNDRNPFVGLGQKDGNFYVAAQTGSNKEVQLGLHFIHRAKPGGFTYPREFASVNIQLDRGKVTVYKGKGWRCPVVSFEGKGHVDSYTNSIWIDASKVTKIETGPGPDGRRRAVNFVVRPKSSRYEYEFRQRDGQVLKRIKKD